MAADAPSHGRGRRSAGLVAALLVLLAVGAGLALTGPGPAPSLPALTQISAWTAGDADGRALPDLDAATPAELRAFFDALEPSARQRLVARHPEVIGNLDGAPPALRYEANRLAMRAAAPGLADTAAAMDRRVALLEARVAATEPTEAAGAPGTAGAAGVVGVASRAWHAFERWRDERELAAAAAQRDQARQVAESVAGWAASDRQFLLFDPRGDGRVAEVVGDLEGAEHVAVLVPGSGQHLGNFEGGPNPGSVPLRNAKALRRAAELAAPGAGTAVVAWLGYDAPEGIDREAVRSERAAAGARDLPGFLAGLDPEGDAHVTLVCHSYGSVVCGLAAHALDVDEVAVLGSPGMRVAEAAELGTPARVWAALAEGDGMALVPAVSAAGRGHGAQPVSADFGARVFGARGAVGHADYYGRGTESLDNLARIVLGRTAEVTCRQPGRCDPADRVLTARGRR